MGRPREFNMDQVLRNVMEAFWERGYENTSFADIEERTGVKKASLCAAYGDKRSLFLKALQKYQENARRATREILVHGSPKDAIRNWLQTVTNAVCIEGADRGCFQVNSLVDRGARDPEVVALSRKHAELMAQMLADVVARGQAAGEFRTDASAETLAGFLQTAIYGLGVTAKTAPSEQQIREVVDFILASLSE